MLKYGKCTDFSLCDWARVSTTIGSVSIYSDKPNPLSKIVLLCSLLETDDTFDEFPVSIFVHRTASRFIFIELTRGRGGGFHASKVEGHGPQ